MKNVKGIIFPVAALIIIGTVMIYSSTALMKKNEFYFLWRHLFTIAMGVTAMLVLSKIDYRIFNDKRVIIAVLALSSVMLLLVLVPGIGVAVKGARRWIRVGPMNFQPSEFAKVAMVLSLSYYMSRYESKMKSFKYGIALPVAVMAVFQIIILKQPDFGAVMSLGILTMTLLFLGGVSLRYIGGLFLLSLPFIFMIVYFESYRLARVTSFLDPWKDPLGKGYQLIQSFIAFGSGGLTGVGLGASRQKLFYLPELHTDFILSLIGEETGLIGVSVVLGLFIWIFLIGINIANKAEDSFTYYLSTGLTVMIVSQALINFAVVVGLMPTKGLPLPFVSFGGSATLINMAAIGILINIQKNNTSQFNVNRSRFSGYDLQVSR
ncbi:MAG: putative lipid II flippase FtsW [Nitrospirae bacterium]|nr:putative lipid II flippase FtsW [Nitrospirota bacterium]